MSKRDMELDAALEAVAEQAADELLDERLEAAISASTKRVITALAGTLSVNPRMGRSKAARLLLHKGMLALQAERTKAARRAARQGG